MDDDDNVYRLEHSGLLNVDKLLSAFCAGLIPAILAFFAKGAIIPVEPKMHEAVFGKDNSRIIKGADGKEYVPGPPEDIKERIIKSLRDNFSSDNPLIDNAITANSTKIYKANRSSMVGLLPERFPRTKQI
jgi:hypothetical protein